LQDRYLIESGIISFDDIVTIRKGELARNPVSDQLEPVRQEFLKINGKGPDWSCRFFVKSSSSCKIYDHRPIACELFKCWDTKDVLSITGRDLLNRFSFITDDSPVFSLIKLYEREFPCPDIEDIAFRLQSSPQHRDILNQLKSLMNLDISLRFRAIHHHNLTISKELFCFGRPLFKVLSPLGVSVKEESGELFLQYRTS